jgi:hypothetical protein
MIDVRRWGHSRHAHLTCSTRQSANLRVVSSSPVCGLVRSAAGIAKPFHVTTERGTNFDPVMVTQVFPVCAAALLGDAAETEGTGFGVEERGSTNGPCKLK